MLVTLQVERMHYLGEREIVQSLLQPPKVIGFEFDVTAPLLR